MVCFLSEPACARLPSATWLSDGMCPTDGRVSGDSSSDVCFLSITFMLLAGL